MKGLGEKLRTARQAKGLTQQTVADLVHIHRTTYTKYETEDVEPTLTTLLQLMELLDIAPEDLLRA